MGGLSNDPNATTVIPEEPQPYLDTSKLKSKKKNPPGFVPPHLLDHGKKKHEEKQAKERAKEHKVAINEARTSVAFDFGRTYDASNLVRFPSVRFRRG